MSKAAEMAKVSARGGFNLMWGLVISTVISFVGILAITIILGDKNYGLYVIAVSGPTLIATFRDWGVNSAMVKYSAQYNVENKAKIRGIIFSGIIFELVLGLSLSVLSLALSPLIATVLNRPTIVPLIQIASFYVLAGALINSATACFTGLEKMHLYSYVLIIQSTIKSALIISLVLLGFGTAGAIWGWTSSSLIAGVTGVLLIWTVYRFLPKPTGDSHGIIPTIKSMLSYGIPVSISTILVAFLSAFYTFTLGIFVKDNAIIGSYGLAVAFSVLITFFSTPVTTMLFPAFSKLDYEKDHETLKNVFQYSVKYASLIVVPITALVMALAQPGVRTVYHTGYTQAPLYLTLLAVPYLYSALGNLSLSNLLNGQGFTRINMWLSAIQAAVGFPLGFLLIWRFGALGLIASTLSVGFPSLYVGLRFIKQKFGVSVDWGSSARILLSSAVTAAVTYLIISEVPLVAFRFVSLPLQQLIVGLVVFVVVFILVAVATRTITRSDVATLRQISEALGPLRGILGFLLNIIEKLMGSSKPTGPSSN